jgi:hypothetical protein
MFEKEYESLRNELNENRKYVFERPLIIFTAALVFFNYISKTEYAALFPGITTFILLFNLQFTSNRMNSSSRIIAYIRLFIEKNDSANYNWESFLDTYRSKYPGRELRYYPMIFYFHIFMILFLIIFETMLLIEKFRTPTTTNQVFDNQALICIIIAIYILNIIYFCLIFKNVSLNHIKKFFHEESENVKNILASMNKG